MPNASLAIGTMRRPSASVTSSLASGMGNPDSINLPAPDHTQRYDDNHCAEHDFRGQPVVGGNRGLPGLAEVQPRQHKQDERNQRQDLASLRPNLGRLT